MFIPKEARRALEVVIRAALRKEDKARQGGEEVQFSYSSCLFANVR